MDVSWLQIIHLFLDPKVLLFFLIDIKNILGLEVKKIMLNITNFYEI